MQKPHSSCLTLSLMVTTKSSWSSLRNGTWIVHQRENRGSKKYQSFNTEGRSCPLGREVTETASSFSHNNMSSNVQHSFRHVQPSSWCVSGLAECYCTHRSFSWPVQSPSMPEHFCLLCSSSGFLRPLTWIRRVLHEHYSNYSFFKFLAFLTRGVYKSGLELPPW